MHENRETSGVSRADRDRSEKALSRTAGMYENGGAKLDHRAANRSCFWAE